MKTSAKKRPVALLLTAALILVLVLTAVILYRNHQNRQAQQRAFEADKAKFTQVEADMQRAFSEIELLKSCEHVALKFEQGPLYCHVAAISSPSVDGLAGLKQAATAFSERIVSTGAFKLEEGMNVQERLDGMGSGRRSVYIGYKNTTEMPCILSVDPERLFNEMQAKRSDTSIKLMFKCRDLAVKPVYTLAK